VHPEFVHIVENAHRVVPIMGHQEKGDLPGSRALLSRPGGKATALIRPANLVIRPVDPVIRPADPPGVLGVN